MVREAAVELSATGALSATAGKGYGVSTSLSAPGSISATGTLIPPTPDQVTDLVRWYRESVVLNGSNVSQWTEKVSGSIHLVQATSTKQPAWSSSDSGMNNQPAWTDDGGDALKGATASDWTFTSDGSGCTIMIVGKYTSAGTQVWLDTRRSTAANVGFTLFGNGTTGAATYAASNGGSSVFSAASANGTFAVDTIHVVVLRYVEGGIPGTSDEYRMRIDGTQRTNGNSVAAPSASAPIDAMCAGARSDAAASFLANGGKISEVAVWNRALTDAEITTTLSPYTTARYGVAA